MQSFLRVTKLHNVQGRAAYIADERRQEQILVSMATDEILQVGWKTIAEFERSHRRSQEANNEAREIVIQLPNSWATLPQQLLSDLCADLSIHALGKDMPFIEFAVHWNHARTNLHMHIIFSERTLAGDTAKRYDRDIYLTQDGKVARKRTERACDANGNTLPPIHRKGELMNPEGFSAKDKSFSQRNWATAALQRVERRFLEFGEKIEERQPWMLHEYHEGKGSASKSIAAKNAGIRAYNACIAFLISKGVNAPQTLKTLYRAAQTDLQAGLPPRVHSELWANLNTQKTVEALCRQAMQLHEGHRKGTLAQRLQQAKQEAMQRNMQRIQQQRNDLDISR